jgi:hypothetical protein
MEAFLGSHVPFTDSHCAIALSPESFGNGDFAWIQSHVVERVTRNGIIGPVELVSEPLLVTAGQEAGARRSANRGCHIALSKPDSVSGNGVDMRSRNLRSPIGAEIDVTGVIGNDHDDIRSGPR